MTDFAKTEKFFDWLYNRVKTVHVVSNNEFDLITEKFKINGRK